MTITARYASRCPCCGESISVGSRVEWERGSSARHVACVAAPAATTAPRPTAAMLREARAWGRPGRTYAEDRLAYDLDLDMY